MPVLVDIVLTQSLPQTETFAFPLDLHLQLLERTLRSTRPNIVVVLIVVDCSGTPHGRRYERAARVDRSESRVPRRSCSRRRRATRVGVLSERRGRR